MENEGLYFVEPLTEHLSRRIKVDRLYYQGETKYQFVQIFYNRFLGKVLFLDKKIQSAQLDEYIYHESLVHPALITHPSPEKILVIGGGEGATLREVLRHSLIQDVIMVDIDRDLVELCKKYLPEWSDGAFSDKKVHLFFGDARRYIEETNEKFDIIISDLTEPVREGPSVGLFSKEFFKKISKVLKEDGIFVLQGGGVDPFYNHFFCSLMKTMERIFPIVNPYWTFILSFSLPWGFILASNREDSLAVDEKKIAQRIRSRKIKGLKYYHSGLHSAYFALPLYLIRDLKKGEILSDDKPFIWKL